jgi:hypothetical protein
MGWNLGEVSAGVRTRLDRIDGAHQVTSEFVRRLLPALEGVAYKVVELLKSLGSSTPPSTLDELTRATATLRRMFQEQPDATDDVLRTARLVLPELLGKAMRERLPAGEATALKEVDGLLTAGDYVGATKRVVEVAKAAARSEGTKQGGAAPNVAEAAAPAPSALARTMGRPSALLMGRAGAGLQPLSAAPEIPTMTSFFQAARLLQLGLLALLLAGLTTALFLNDWVGTTLDVVKVFAWSSALDISVAALTGNISKLVSK